MKRVRKTLKKYFVPHAENDHRPHILRARSVAFVLVMALAIEGMFWFGASQLATRSQLFGIVVANALVDETNQSRTTNQVAALTVNPLLQAAAQEKVADMVANNYFAHTSPSGITPWYWLGQVGYNFEYAGENLAVNFSDSQDVMNAWMTSAEHRANILNPNFTQIGIATATGTYEGAPAVYVVEFFGTPVPPPPPAEPIPFINSAAAATPAKPKVAGATVKFAHATTTSAIATTSALFLASVTATSSHHATATAPVSRTTAERATVSDILPQGNLVQNAAANPRAVVDDIYLAIIAIFALALGINLFVKIRIQHPQIIFGGMLVILVAGMLIVLNAHLLASAAIL